MIAVYDFTPSFCPNCGKEINLQGRASGGYWRDADYNAGASHQCPGCGLMYQRAAKEDILTAANAFGTYADLRQYA